jgi:hypothetical protein
MGRHEVVSIGKDLHAVRLSHELENISLGPMHAQTRPRLRSTSIVYYDLVNWHGHMEAKQIRHAAS